LKTFSATAPGCDRFFGRWKRLRPTRRRC
jgi:hypothetical protein